MGASIYIYYLKIIFCAHLNSAMCKKFKLLFELDLLVVHNWWYFNLAAALFIGRKNKQTTFFGKEIFANPNEDPEVQEALEQKNKAQQVARLLVIN